jgi:hypothetical protein
MKPVRKKSIIQKQNVSCGKPHELELRLMKCRVPVTDNGALLTVCDCAWESLPEQKKKKWKACPVNARTNKTLGLTYRTMCLSTYSYNFHQQHHNMCVGHPRQSTDHDQSCWEMNTWHIYIFFHENHWEVKNANSLLILCTGSANAWVLVSWSPYCPVKRKFKTV